MVSAVTRSASRAASVPSAETSSLGRHAQEDRDHRQDQEDEADPRREDERRPEEPVYDLGLGSGRNP